jgi:DNA-binding MarR family transcriptional regulator
MRGGVGLTRFATSLETRILQDIGFCGNFLRFRIGGKSGKSHILCFLEKNGGGAAQREMQAEFKLKPASLSEVLAKLEDEGTIVRTRDANDSRKLNVELTDLGKKIAIEQEGVKAAFERKAFGCFTNDEQEQLLALLDRLKDYWETMND